MFQMQDQLYDRLMEINNLAFTAGSYEVAFHALSAAFHRAKDLQVAPLLRNIYQRANEQLYWIDTYNETHMLSSSSAASRGNESIYRLLIKQIEIEEKKLQWRNNL